MTSINIGGLFLTLFLTLGFGTSDAPAAFDPVAAQKEAERLETLVAPWVGDGTFLVVHVNLQELKLWETYDRNLAEAEKILKRTLTQNNECTAALRHVETVLGMIEKDFAKLAGAGCTDIFLVADTNLLEQNHVPPVVVLLPVDVTKKAFVRTVSESILSGAAWLPEDVRNEISLSFITSVIGDYVVFVPAAPFTTEQSGYDAEDISAYLEKIRETIVASPRPELSEMLKLTAGSSVKGIFLPNDHIRETLPEALAELRGNVPADFPLPTAKAFSRIVKAASVEIDLFKEDFAVRILSENEQAAKDAFRILDAYQKIVLKLIEKETPDETVKAIASDFVDLLFERLVPKREGNHIFWNKALFTERFPDTNENIAIATGAMMSMLLPAIDSVRGSARRIQSMNNMKQITISMLCYESMYGSYPPAYTVDKDGKPLHSWRVLILPFLEQEALYKAIRLDEPWDSEWNSQFHNVMLPVFQAPNTEQRVGGATYAVVVGEETIFPPEGKTVKIAQVKDGLSNTILVVERTPVCWMDPLSDVPFAEAVKGINFSRNGIYGSQKGVVSVGFADGSIRHISETIDPEVLKALLTKAGGEAIPYGEWDY